MKRREGKEGTEAKGGGEGTGRFALLVGEGWTSLHVCNSCCELARNNGTSYCLLDLDL